MSASVDRLISAERIPRLDVLRGLAILGVFFFHYAGALRTPFALLDQGSATSLFTKQFHAWFFYLSGFGSMGVPLFFVISGFCIHLAFLRAPERFRAWDFFQRRFLRLYPAYFVALLFFSVGGLLHIFPSVNLKMFLAHIFLVHNFFNEALFLSINAVFWSLAVEFQFYLLYPLLLRWRGAMGLKACLFFTVLLCLANQLACSASPAFSSWSQSGLCVGRTVFTWCDWIFGACLAEAFVNSTQLFAHRWFWLASSLALCLLAHAARYTMEFNFLLSSLFFAVVAEIYLGRKTSLGWWERAIVPVGLVSYSTYLWHMPLIVLIFKYVRDILPLPENLLTELAIYLPLTMLLLSPVFIVSYFLLEQKLSQWLRQKWFHLPAPRVEPAPPLAASADLTAG